MLRDQLVTFTLAVIEEPHCEVKVTLYGPRSVFFDTTEKFWPLETVCDAGDTVRLEGNVATTRLGLFMLTWMLPVPPPFFLILIVDELTCMLQEGGPESAPMPPPERSIHGVLSNVDVPFTPSRVLMLSDEVTVLL